MKHNEVRENIIKYLIFSYLINLAASLLNSFYTNSNKMFQNLIKVALRNIQRQKFFSILNIVGLSVGICSVILISLYIMDEVNFDKFHAKADRIYRINQTFIWGDDDNLFSSTGPAVANALRAEIPEFEAVTRVHPIGDQRISYEGKVPYNQFYEGDVLAVDGNFLEVFTFPLVKGDILTALKEPYSILLTVEAKEKYFGDSEALGEILWLGEEQDKKPYKVTGLLTDVPENSHIQFSMLVSMNSNPYVAKRDWSWIWTTFVTFGVLNEQTEIASLTDRLEEVPRKHAGSSLKRTENVTFEEWEADGREWKLYAQPLLDVHLFSENIYNRLNDTRDFKQIVVFGIIGMMILLMCMVNFINLTTARSFSRAKEIGIRKIVGSPKKLLIYQFLSESIIISLIALIIGLLLLELILPSFNVFSGKAISFSPLDNPWLLGVIATSPLLIGLLAGLYPAFFMTSFAPIKALKNKMGSSTGNTTVRNVLVVFQFSISIILISATIIIFNQLEHQKNIDLGFNRENKLIIEGTHRLGQSAESFKNTLENMGKIESVAISGSTPPYFYNSDKFNIKGSTKGDFPLNYVVVNEGFVETYDLEMLSGRNFQEGFKEENRGLVNEAFVKQLGLEVSDEIIGKKLTYYDNEIEIIGLYKDFYTDYTSKVRPLVLLYEGTQVYTALSRHLSIEMSKDLSSHEIQDLVVSIENEWNNFSQQAAFKYTFLDQTYEAQFRPTIYFGKLITALSILALIIASLGLIGLMTFSIEKRGKEIGVRKVLGATIANIFSMLSKQFAKLLLIAFIIAIPITWYFMEIWLTGFEQRREITLFDFVLGGSMMLLIALFVTSFQMVRASISTPVKALKDE